MAVRTSYVGTQVAGDVLTAANFTKLPGGWIGYAEVTANQAGITTVVDLTGLTVTVTVGTSRRIRITGHIGVGGSVNGDAMRLSIKEGGTVLQIRDRASGSTLATLEEMNAEAVLTPTSGAHTYKLTLERAGGTGTLTLGAAATFPSFILVEDLGPAA